jgi:hypothetical protein
VLIDPNLLPPQPHDDIDAGNLVAIQQGRHLANKHVACGNVHEFIFVFDKKVVVRRIVSIEIVLRGINCDMTQEAHFGELV